MLEGDVSSDVLVPHVFAAALPSLLVWKDLMIATFFGSLSLTDRHSLESI